MAQLLLTQTLSFGFPRLHLSVQRVASSVNAISIGQIFEEIYLLCLPVITKHSPNLRN